MKNVTELKNGFVIDRGVVVYLTQQAYYGHDNMQGGSLPAYFANGVDVDGNEYQVVWHLAADYDAAYDRVNEATLIGEPPEHEDITFLEDETLACDWENPYRVELL